MFNSNGFKLSCIVAGAAFALCVVCMMIGGLTWGSGLSGWAIFLASIFSVCVGRAGWLMYEADQRKQWAQDRNDVYERLTDAQSSIKAEEREHSITKRTLVTIREELNRERGNARTAQENYENMRNRCSQKDTEIKTLKAQIAAGQQDRAELIEEINKTAAQRKQDNDTWRKQVSNLATRATELAAFLDKMSESAMLIPADKMAIGNAAAGLRQLARAGGVPTGDDAAKEIDG